MAPCFLSRVFRNRPSWQWPAQCGHRGGIFPRALEPAAEGCHPGRSLASARQGAVARFRNAPLPCCSAGRAQTAKLRVGRGKLLGLGAAANGLRRFHQSAASAASSASGSGAPAGTGRGNPYRHAEARTARTLTRHRNSWSREGSRGGCRQSEWSQPPGAGLASDPGPIECWLGTERTRASKLTERKHWQGCKHTRHHDKPHRASFTFTGYQPSVARRRPVARIRKALSLKGSMRGFAGHNPPPAG